MSTGAFEGRFDALRDLPLRSGRACLEIPVDVRGSGASSVAVTRNISLDGAFVETRRLLPPGERVTLRLSVPGYGAPFEVDAEVRWSRSHGEANAHGRPPGLGVRFLDPPGSVSLCLAGLLHLHRSR